MSRNLFGAALAAMALAHPASAFAHGGPDLCRFYKHEGVIKLPVNPAFLHIDSPEGSCSQELSVTSFANTAPAPAGSPAPFVFLEGDQVLRIPNVTRKAPAAFTNADFERLTDESLPDTSHIPGGGPGFSWMLHGKTIWPNEARRAPAGAFPFEAMTVAQGFHVASKAGRLTLLDLTNDNLDGTTPEYVIAQSTNQDPHFYHRAVFADMDNDGDLDVITVRSGFSVGNFASMGGPQPAAPSGELLWFEHPGMDADFKTATWNAHLLFLSPFNGPDVNLDAADLDGDGVVEIVTTAFFESLPRDRSAVNSGRFQIFAKPAILPNWVGAAPAGPIFPPNPAQPRQAVLAADQGAPFAVELVDLDDDGDLDVLASNHMPDDQTFTSDVAGRVIAFEHPGNGVDLLATDSVGVTTAWNVHVLMDDIRPNLNPAFPPANFPGRLAPGHAHAFRPLQRWGGKPWIVLSGDQASEVWLLVPSKHHAWQYRAESIFDISRYPELYPTGTQNLTQAGVPNARTIAGRFISTIGSSAIGYDDRGFAKIFVPVFEARDIHVISLNPFARGERLRCE